MSYSKTNLISLLRDKIVSLDRSLYYEKDLYKKNKLIQEKKSIIKEINDLIAKVNLENSYMLSKAPKAPSNTVRSYKTNREVSAKELEDLEKDLGFYMRKARKSRKVSRKASRKARKSRKVSRKARKVSRKVRKVSRKVRKVSRKVSRKARKSRKVSRKARKSRKVSRKVVRK